MIAYFKGEKIVCTFNVRFNIFYCESADNSGGPIFLHHGPIRCQTCMVHEAQNYCVGYGEDLMDVRCSLQLEQSESAECLYLKRYLMR